MMNAPLKRKPKAQFSWEDPFLLEQQLTEDERMVKEAAAAYCTDKLEPRVLEAFRHEKVDVAVFREMGALGLLGPTIPTEYGGPGLSYVCYGLIAREVERVDSGYRSTMSVQSSLVMLPIFEFGTEAQRKKYLPKLASGEWIGCFGLTEPNHGSDPGSMASRAKKVKGGYRVSGSKMWILGAERPCMPLSRMKPRISPTLPFSSASFAQTTKTSARGELEIHIFEPLTR